jgi:hypothetical protein
MRSRYAHLLREPLTNRESLLIRVKSVALGSGGKPPNKNPTPRKSGGPGFFVSYGTIFRAPRAFSGKVETGFPAENATK